MNNHSIANMKTCDHLRQAIEAVNIARFQVYGPQSHLHLSGSPYVKVLL